MKPIEPDKIKDTAEMIKVLSEFNRALRPPWWESGWRVMAFTGWLFILITAYSIMRGWVEQSDSNFIAITMTVVAVLSFIGGVYPTNSIPDLGKKNG